MEEQDQYHRAVPYVCHTSRALNLLTIYHPSTGLTPTGTRIGFPHKLNLQRSAVYVCTSVNSPTQPNNNWNKRKKYMDAFKLVMILYSASLKLLNLNSTSHTIISLLWSNN
jgi:hypothetical protein